MIALVGFIETISLSLVSLFPEAAFLSLSVGLSEKEIIVLVSV